jgi:hypothetical protein
MRMLASLLALLLAAPAAAQSIVVSYDDCVELTKHIPDADVKYRPDADPDVAPADIGGRRRILVPKEFRIPITVELEKRFGIPNNNQYKAEAHIGVVEWKNGRAWFNGQPLGSDEQRAIGYLCRERVNAQR